MGNMFGQESGGSQQYPTGTYWQQSLADEMAYFQGHYNPDVWNGRGTAEYQGLASLLANSRAEMDSVSSENYLNDALLGPSMRAFNKTTRPAIESAFANYGGTLSSRRGQTIAQGAQEVQANAQAGLAQILPQLFQAKTQRSAALAQGYSALYDLGQAPWRNAAQFAAGGQSTGGNQSGQYQSNGLAGAFGMLGSALIAL